LLSSCERLEWFDPWSNIDSGLLSVKLAAAEPDEY